MRHRRTGMDGFWLGQCNWLWLADAVLVALGIVLLVTANNDGTRLLAVFIAGSRLLFAGVQVLLWERRRSTYEARDGRATPPR